MVENIGYKLSDFIRNAIDGKLTKDDFIELNISVPNSHFNELRKNVLPKLNDGELLNFATNVITEFMGDIAIYDTQSANDISSALIQGVLLRAQNKDHLLVKDIMMEIGKRNLTLPNSHENLIGVELDPIVLSCYTAYKDKMVEIMPTISEEKVKAILRNDIKNTFSAHKASINENNIENWVKVNFSKLAAGDNGFVQRISNALKPALNNEGLEIERGIDDALQTYDIAKNQSLVTEHIVNYNIAFSISFVMYKGIAINNLNNLSLEDIQNNNAALFAQKEFAEPHGVYVSALKMQDLFNKIPSKEAVQEMLSSRVNGITNTLEEGVLKLEMNAVDESKRRSSFIGGNSLIEGIEQSMKEFVEKCEKVAKKASVNIEKATNAVMTTFYKLSSLNSILKSDDVKLQRHGAFKRKYDNGAAKVFSDNVAIELDILNDNMQKVVNVLPKDIELDQIKQSIVAELRERFEGLSKSQINASFDNHNWAQEIQGQKMQKQSNQILR